jgi:hypothetical protein
MPKARWGWIPSAVIPSQAASPVLARESITWTYFHFPPYVNIIPADEYRQLFRNRIPDALEPEDHRQFHTLLAEPARK